MFRGVLPYLVIRITFLTPPGYGLSFRRWLVKIRPLTTTQWVSCFHLTRSNPHILKEVGHSWHPCFGPSITPSPGSLSARRKEKENLPSGGRGANRLCRLYINHSLSLYIYNCIYSRNFSCTSVFRIRTNSPHPPKKIIQKSSLEKREMRVELKLGT